jgi:hypothetical protein
MCDGGRDPVDSLSLSAVGCSEAEHPQEGSDDNASIVHPPMKEWTKSSPNKPNGFGDRNKAPNKVIYGIERNHYRH